MNRPEINVTPLIDVLLVVVTPTKPSSFDARIPSKPRADPKVLANPDTLVVSNSFDGTIQINRESTGDLSSRLQEIFRLREENANRERTVFIKAPTSLEYGSVAKLIDAVEAGGRPSKPQIDDLE